MFLSALPGWDLALSAVFLFDDLIVGPWIDDGDGGGGGGGMRRGRASGRGLLLLRNPVL